MIQLDVSLSYTEDYPALYFNDFVDEVKETGLNLAVETRKNETWAGIEWLMFPAIMIYLGKPFVDDFLKRAATDVNNVAYPKFKTTLAKLVKRIFVHQQPTQVIVATAPGKVTRPDVLLFAVYSKTNDGKSLKFIFQGDLTEQEYEDSVQYLLSTLQAHLHAPATEDMLSQQIAGLSDSSTKNVYLLYDEQAGNWNVIEPAALIAKGTSAQN